MYVINLCFTVFMSYLPCFCLMIVYLYVELFSIIYFEIVK